MIQQYLQREFSLSRFLWTYLLLQSNKTLFLSVLLFTCRLSFIISRCNQCNGLDKFCLLFQSAILNWKLFSQSNTFLVYCHLTSISVFKGVCCCEYFWVLKVYILVKNVIYFSFFLLIFRYGILWQAYTFKVQFFLRILQV